jgi:UDP-N-acetyl-2-amino-2-deoxyglucuronate dehydrogenase
LIDFFRAIEGAREPLVDGREGRRSVEIIRAIYRSAESGSRVMLPLDD